MQDRCRQQPRHAHTYCQTMLPILQRIIQMKIPGEKSADMCSAMNPGKRGTESLRPNRNAIYNAVINRMVRESLEQKETDFAIAHAQDSDAELLNYLRRCAAELRHSPWPKEIVGWKYLTERFGDWGEMLKKAYLPMPNTSNKPFAFLLTILETEDQKQIYRQRKEEKKAKAAERLRMQAEKKR